MGDGASSSSDISNSNTSTTGGGGGDGRGKGEGETVVVDHGKRRNSCGYCRSNAFSSISHGLSAHSMTVYDYQELLDRGWRRSGCFLYKPEMEKTCCPSYTIRLKAGGFVPSKDQIRVHKKMQRFLDGKLNKAGCLKDKPDSPKVAVNTDRDASSSSSVVPAASRKEFSAGICKNTDEEIEFINYLSRQIDEAVSICVRSGEFSCTLQLPKAIVKPVSSKAKRKLMEISEDLLYTSNISFQIAAALRHLCPSKENVSPSASPNLREKGEKLNISPNMVAEKLACSVGPNLKHSGLIAKACNGHLNFYSTKKNGQSVLSHDKCMETSKGNASGRKQSFPTHNGEIMPCKRRRLEIKMKRSTFDPEEFALYRKYQIKVHGDKPEKVTESSYKSFLVDTPLVFVPPQCKHRDVPPCGFGSFHQQYIIDGKLVAVGVVDILPKCLSSKYLFWDPDFAFLSLGKYSALQEINWVQQAQAHCSRLQYYYLGYYIHSCDKMRYKAAYHPSELLCPLRYVWVPFENARPLLDQRPYVILSDYMTLNNQTSSPQLPSTSIARSNSPYKDNPDDLTAADIGDIMIDLGASRVKFKDLERVFGPINKRYIKELEMQLQRYVIAVGRELSNRMLYSLV